MRDPYVAVLGSTRGTDLGSLLEAFSMGCAAGASISVVVSNRKSSEILGRAEAAGIPAVHVPCPKGMAREAYDQAVTAVLEEHGPIDLVLMIGYMRIVSPSFTARWRDRLVGYSHRVLFFLVISFSFLSHLPRTHNSRTQNLDQRSPVLAPRIRWRDGHGRTCRGSQGW